VDRVVQHAEKHTLPIVKIVFHGGEPLLAGVDVIVETADLLRGKLPLSTRVDFDVQTNAVLLSERVLDHFLTANVNVSVSLDGAAEHHDRHRRFRSGKGSHAAVSSALELLGRDPYQRIYRGLLCTIDLDNDPLDTYESLLHHAPPGIDLLLPHGNWTVPPPGRTDATSVTPYADWLRPIFDRWFVRDVENTRVRLFDEIINLLLGGPSRSEAVGLSRVGLIVVDTSGAIEQVDVLKSAYHGAAAVGLNVFSDSFDAALEHPAIAARQIGVDALHHTCQRCTVRDVCGGGYYPHRYREGEGYRNRSAYCPDLFALIGHIQHAVEQEVEALRSK
jgi:uncharacterized protein